VANIFRLCGVCGMRWHGEICSLTACRTAVTHRTQGTGHRTQDTAHMRCTCNNAWWCCYSSSWLHGSLQVFRWEKVTPFWEVLLNGNWSIWWWIMSLLWLRITFQHFDSAIALTMIGTTMIIAGLSDFNCFFPSTYSIMSCTKECGIV